MFVASPLVGCGSYTSEARKEQIGTEIDTFNQASSKRAVAEALARRNATAMELRPEWFSIGSDLERCWDGTTQPLHLERKDAAPIDVDCRTLRNAISGNQPLEAKATDGTDVLLIASGSHGQSFLAAAGDGKILVVTVGRKIVERRPIRIPGNCDRMPGYESTPPTLSFWILPGRAARDVERIGVSYEAMDVEYRCDTYTY